jgi:hypothetical protein
MARRRVALPNLATSWSIVSPRRSPRARAASSKPSWRGASRGSSWGAAMPQSRTRPPLRGSMATLASNSRWRPGEQLDRGADEDAAVAGGGGQGGAPGDLAEVVVLDDEDGGAGAQAGGAEAGGDAVGLVEQEDGELALVVDVVVEGLLVADGDRVALGDDGARILAAGERREVVAGGVADPGDQGGLGVARDVADGLEAHRREDLAGGVVDAPEPGDRQRVEEREELIGRHDPDR